MGKMIDGIKITPKKQILDERGKIMHMLRNNDPEFSQFGEIYFSVIYPNAIKAWHVHKTMTLNYVVVHGNIKLVLYDLRENSKTKGNLQEIFLGESSYNLVTIPPGIANGFKAVGNLMAIVANCATEPHTTGEISRIDPYSDIIPYSWEIKNG